ncbi:MAG: glycosyltransferase [Alphaproteobacteria bacterium]|nr:glycosyltransferase [Alphaproteobacteria bacterium]
MEEGALRLALVTPVHDDWPAFLRLVGEISALSPQGVAAIEILVVNDGSLLPPPEAVPAGGLVERVEILELACNLGHQRAIALGLAQVVTAGRADIVAVMDSDGEDRPQDLAALIAAQAAAPGSVAVARRTRRSEGPVFALFYVLYKLLFRMLTGQSISFGNFAVLPFAAARRLAYMAETWNHLAGALVRSRLPLAMVPTARGRRWFGVSRLGFIGVTVHGLQAVSVFADRLFARLLLLSAALAAFSLGAAAVVVGIRLFTTLAIPGWASGIVGLLAVVFLQAILLSVSGVVLVLSSRAMPGVVPMRMLADLALGCRPIARPG